jgi:hypothetical protein
MGRKKKISLLPHEREALVNLYLKWKIPIGQFQRRPAELEAFMEEWRSLTGRSDTAGEVVHYMRNQRQQGLWVKLGDKALPAPPLATFTAEESELLVVLFKKYVTAAGEGSGVLDQEPEIAQNIANEFAAITGRVVAPNDITAKLTALRRRGTFPKVGRKISHASTPPDLGFTDIDQALRKVDGQ